MNKLSRILCAVLAICMLCSCSRISDYSEIPDSSEVSESESETNNRFEESDVRVFNINKKDFITKLNAEGGSHSGTILEDGDFDGRGYLRLQQSQILKHILNVNTSQHYRIIIAARSETGSAISLKVSGKVCGAYYIPKYQADSNDSENVFKFEYYAVDHQYLEAGQNVIQFTVESGTAEIDYIVCESSDMIDGACYNAGSGFANANSSLRTAEVMRYFSDIYGEQTITAQNVTFGTNIELNAVYKATGRYPAIRASELADADSDDETTKAETELALKFGNDGGILSYVWHWYSPNIKHSVNKGAFDISAAFEGQRPEEVALFDDDELNAQINGGFLSSELISLIDAADKMAEILKPFSDADIPVLFQPIPDPDAGMYWWGDSSEDYIALWRFLFDRLCTRHKLKNLIWVWNGSSEKYFPGERYVDIVGQSFYENSNASFAGRFYDVYSVIPTTKMLGITFCDVLPSIDYMCRDNALWLFAAAGSGEYTVKSSGELSESFNTVTSLHYFYNNRRTVTLDELPDFSIR